MITMLPPDAGPSRRPETRALLRPAPPRRKIDFATSPDDNIIAHDRPRHRTRR
jgi:hypothetical protein